MGVVKTVSLVVFVLR